MQVKFYHDLYVSDIWMNKKKKIMKKLQENRLQPEVYVITLAGGKQNNLEFYSSMLLKQHIFDKMELFVVGIADGYMDALYMVERITDDVFRKTGDAEIRRYLLARQDEYERTGR